MDDAEDQLRELEAMYSDDDKPKKEKKPKKKVEQKGATSGASKTNENIPIEKEGGDIPSKDNQTESAAAKKKAKKATQKEKKQNPPTSTSTVSETTTTTTIVDAVEDKNSASSPAVSSKESSVEPGATSETTSKSVKPTAGSKAAALSKKEQEKQKGAEKRAAFIKKQLAQKQAEEEERRRKEEEEEQRLLEFHKQKEEKERIEKERRDKKKLREKERIARMKREGTYLNEKQKFDRARFEQMLAERNTILPPPTAADSSALTEAGGEGGEGGIVKTETTTQNKKPKYESLNQKKKKQQAAKAQAAQAEMDSLEKTKEEDKNGKTANEIENIVKKSEILDDWETQYDEILLEKQKEIHSHKDVASVSSESKSGSSNESDEDDDVHGDSEDPLAQAQRMVERYHKKCETKRTVDKLRCPVICVLGHVDTGKTKILDKLRKTNVQDGEAGGITQQIGATNVPKENIILATKQCMPRFNTEDMKIPGLLIIDTPGHESFSNLRDRGSSLCDLAILVVDLMHSLEKQTLESIQLLKKRKTPFVVALNKIDRLNQFKSDPTKDVEEVMKSQEMFTQQDFKDRLNKVIADFAKEEINARLFYEKPPEGVSEEDDDFVYLIPTSAHSGDGMGNLLSYLCQTSEQKLSERLSYSEELQAIVMEVKEIPGLGTTIDVILINGRLREGDTIIVPGQEGPIVTQIRALLMPAPMRELRVKGTYDHRKEVVAAQGVKISAKELEKSLAGLPMYATNDPLLVNYYKDLIQRNLSAALKSFVVADIGVHVQASTLGSLEALLTYLKSESIPYASIGIGPVHKRDVIKTSIMIERDAPTWAVILAFDVKIEREAQEMADKEGVRIFTANIIYHLLDQLNNYVKDVKLANKDRFREAAVFPVKLFIMPENVFCQRAPIIAGVRIEGGQLRVGTPLCVPDREMLDLGRVASIEFNHKPLTIARKGQEVCIRIEPSQGDTPKMYGRHFDDKDIIVSKITRQGIDALREYFRDEMDTDDWKLVKKLKDVLKIL